jgi:hypothetical protein
MAKKRGKKEYSLGLMIILTVFFACLFTGGITFYIVYAPEQFKDYNPQTSQYSEGTIPEGTKTGVIVSENQ